MIRRLIALAALLLPGGVFVGFSACSDNPSPDNLCGWLVDDNNCYARFADDVGNHCGKDFVAGSDVLQSVTGEFSERDDLTECFMYAGGIVAFDPPPDVTAFPPTAFTFTITDWAGIQCAAGAWSNVTGVAPSSQQTFSITINPVDLNDAGVSVTGLSDHIVGGTFSSAIVVDDETDPPEVRADAFDISCPGGQESHRFDRLHMLKCADLEDILPQAIVDVSPGVPEPPPGPTGPSGVSAQAGFIRLRIVYPPVTGTTDPRVVEYFNCLIPAPLPPCADGEKNYTETDVDCGGFCPDKCETGLMCVDGDDCVSGTCSVQEGLKLCQ